MAANGLRNSVKRYSVHLNMDPNLHAKYQNHNSRGSQDVVLRRFFFCYNGRVEEGA